MDDEMKHLDDLPERSGDHVGEAEGTEAVHRTFKDPQFLIQRKDVYDYGVDFLIELLLSSGPKVVASNIRFHAQLKSSTKAPNKDDSFSYPVARANLNYLLNNPGSLYLFFDRESKTLYSRWADDVYVEYEKQGIAWRTQADITVKFQCKLTDKALFDIHRTILVQAKEQRNIRLRMRLQEASSEVRFAYDSSQSSLVDEGKIMGFLSSRGLAWASHGHAQEVVDLGHRVALSLLDAPARLSIAYASYLLSKNGAAIEMLHGTDKTLLANDNQRALCEHLDAALQRSLGLMDRTEYLIASRNIEERYPNSVSAIYSKLERLRSDGIEGDTGKYIEQAKELVGSLQAKGASWAPIAVQAEFVELELRFFLLERQYTEQVMRFRFLQHLGMSALGMNDRAADAALLFSGFAQVWKDFEVAIEIARKLGFELVLAEGLHILSACMIHDAQLSAKVAPQTEDIKKSITKMLERTIARLEMAAALFEKNGATEKKIESDLLMIEALWLLGRKEAVLKKAEESSSLAQRTGCIEAYTRAKAILSGQSPSPELEHLPTVFDI